MADTAKQEPVITMWSKEFTYDRWMKTKGNSDSPGLLHRRLAHHRTGMVGRARLQIGVHSTARAKKE